MKYEFVKYSPTSKIDCPSCGHKKCLVRYVDTETGELMPDKYGKCDRENTCTYWMKPFYETNGTTTPSAIVEIPQQFISPSVIESCMKWYDKNPLIVSLVEKFGEENVKIAIEKYYIGTSKDLFTLFFCIDYDATITSVKAIKYIKFNRDKSVSPFYPYKTSDGYYPCLFGMHLVDKNKDVHIVESEKTALIMSMIINEPYLATGGANSFTLKKAKAFKDIGFTGVCYLYPDCDKAGREAVLKWKENLDAYNIRNEIVDIYLDKNNGEDQADMLLEVWEK